MRCDFDKNTMLTCFKHERGLHESDWSQSFYSPAANSARSTSVVKVSRARAHKHSYILLLNALSMCARVANHIPIQPTSLNDKSDTESLCFIPKPSTCRKLKTMSRDVVNGAAWHTDSERAVFVYRCGIVMTWDIAMGRAIQMTEHRFPMSVAVGPYLEKMLVAVSGIPTCLSKHGGEITHVLIVRGRPSRSRTVLVY